jgi:hypothetical protein
MAKIEPVNWNNKQAWPYGGAAHMFIGEAIEVVGRYLFGAEWTGEEFWSGFREELLLEPSGKFESATDSRRYDVARLLRHSHPDYVRATEKSLNADLWAAAQAIYPEYKDKRREAQARLREAKSKLRELCAHGELVAAIRWEDNGDHSRMEATQWNTEEFLRWLAYGQVNGHYLFIEADGLKEMKASEPKLPDTGPAHLSPYLRLMITVAHELGVSKENQPRKDEVIEKLKRVSKRPGMSRMSETALGYAATFIREPESQSGAASELRRKREKG